MNRVNSNNISEGCPLAWERRRIFFAVVLAWLILGVVYAVAKITSLA